MDKQKLAGHLAVAAAYTIFGLNLVFCKDIANASVVDPIVLFTLRAIGATALFWLISLFQPRERIAKEDWVPIIFASLFGLFLTQYTFLEGITLVTAIDAAIIGTLSPIFTMLFAFFFQKEPITLQKAGGVAISFAGILFLILNSVRTGGADVTSPLGVVLLLLNSLCFAFYLGRFRQVIAKYSVVTFMKWMFLVSLLISLPFSTGKLIHTDFTAIPGSVLWEIGYLVFFATFVAYFLIPFGQKRIRPTLVSMYSYIQPFLATVLSIVWGLDFLTWKKIIATLLVVGGVILVNRSRAKATS